MSVNLYNKLEPESGYKLVHLSDDLLQALQEGDVKLKALSDDTGDVVLCSEDKTWVIKQRNHSNTVILMREFVPEADGSTRTIETFGLPEPMYDWAGFCTLDNELEPRSVEGSIDVTQLDIYDGRADSNFNRRVSLQEFKDMSPCSEQEFAARWFEAGGSVVNGYACLLSERFLLKALHIVLITCMAESIDIESVSISRLMSSMDKDASQEGSSIYTKDVVSTVINKFGVKKADDVDECEAMYEMNMPLIARWYGISALKRYATKEPISEDEFMVQWKAQFPPYFNCTLNISMLRGSFVRPLSNHIRYMSRSALSFDPKERFQQLFHWQSSWEQDDIVPYLEEINTKKVKMDIFIMKYAKRKRTGNKFIITSR